MALRLTQFGGGVKKIEEPRPGTFLLPDCRSAIDNEDLTRGDGRLIGRQIDSHVSHVNRQPESEQMRGRKLLDVLRAFEQFFYPIR